MWTPNPCRLDHVPGPRTIEFPAQMAPSPLPEPGWVFFLVHPPRPGMRREQWLVSAGHVDMQDGVCTRLCGMDLGVWGRRELGLNAALPYTSLPALPWLVQNSEESKNSKSGPGHPGRVDDIHR